MRTPEMIAPGRGNGAGAGETAVEGGIDKAHDRPHGAAISQCRADSICLAIAVPIFCASYSLEELRQYRAARGHRVREVAARVALMALRLVWRALP
jgi:hypothetical protein